MRTVEAERRDADEDEAWVRRDDLLRIEARRQRLSGRRRVEPHIRRGE